MSNEKYRRRATLIPGIWLPAIFVDPFKRCTHSRYRMFYGDEINAMGGARSRCLDCGRLLGSNPNEMP